MKRKTLALVLTLGLVAAACGGDDDDTGAADEPAEATAEPADEPADEPAEESEEMAEEPADEPSEEMAEESEEMAEESEEMAEEADDPGLAAAQAAVEAARVDPTEIGVTIPLDGTPEPATVYWIQGEAPSAAAIRLGLEPATEALGWELVTIQSEAAAPEPAFAQALDEGADYIVISGSPQAVYPEGLANAQAAGVPILSLYSTEDPSPESGVYTQFGDESLVEKSGALMANWITADSGGSANVLIATISLFPVLVAEAEAFEAEMNANCGDCSVQTLDHTLDDLITGRVPSLVSDRLAADPDINYVFFTFGDNPGGVSATLAEVGLAEQVKLVGQDFNSADLQELIDGTHVAWSGQPKAYAGWLAIDAAARLSLGMELTEERQAAALPIVLVEDAAKAQAILDIGGDWAPEGMAESFKTLWGVG